MKEKIEEILQTFFGDRQRSKKTIYLIIIAVVALFLLILGKSFPTKSNENDPKEREPAIEPAEETSKNKLDDDPYVDHLEKAYERDLKGMLEKTQNIQEVEVMVNLDSTDIKIYEKNLLKGQQTTNEKDSNNGVRKVEDQTEETEVVLVRKGDEEVPLLVQTKKPKVRGVLVVANGVNNGEIKMSVIEAVSKVLEVPTHKVSVLPRNKEDKK